jgi:hypothetical protein
MPKLSHRPPDFEESSVPLSRNDDSGGFYFISGMFKTGGERIDSLLAGQMGCINHARAVFSKVSQIMSA